MIASRDATCIILKQASCNCDLVVNPRFVAKGAFRVDVGATPGHSPVGLAAVLIIQELQEVARHEVMIAVGLGSVRPGFNELISECIDKGATHWDAIVVAPNSHHSAKRFQIAING